MVQTNRRQFVGIALSSAVLQTANRLAGAKKPNLYVRANTDWLAKCRFGIGIHWTAQTVPRNGSPKPFQKAVADFDLEGLIAAVEHAGADYVLFTAAHALQMLPAPNPVLDKILPGRTCERDLIRELADALAAKQKHLLVCHGNVVVPWSEGNDLWHISCRGVMPHQDDETANADSSGNSNFPAVHSPVSVKSHLGDAPVNCVSRGC